MKHQELTAELRTHIFFIPRYRIAKLNDLMFAKIWTRIKLSKECRELVAWYGKDVPKATAPRRVSLTVVMRPRMRPCDVDAFNKALLDSLASAGLILGDRPGQCEIGSLEQRPAAEGEEWGSLIVLEDLP